MNERKYILMSIKPQYAEAIKSGEKTVELRRVAPSAHPGDIIVIYESSPVKKITSYFEIDSILCVSPKELWNKFGSSACISKKSFDAYFQAKKVACGIKIKNVSLFPSPFCLTDLSETFTAPQSYRFITQEQFSNLMR